MSHVSKRIESIVHCLRAPVGGVFRHVCDLAECQAKMGFDVGVICDASTGGEQADAELQALSAICSLGIHRVPMGRMPGLSDFKIRQQVSRICENIRPTIVHGHGAKGGAFARLLSKDIGAKIIYTPHGGVLHYNPMSLKGFVFFTMERYLRKRMDGLILASEYSRRKYEEKVGAIDSLCAVIYNGLKDSDFVTLSKANSEFDFVYVGELRRLKGLDTLLSAMIKVRSTKPDVSLLIVGDGPDNEYFRRQVQQLGLASCVRIVPAIYPATRAFAMGGCLVMPSHAESLPYIVLEAAAANMPIIATRVGGIPEIFGRYADKLIPPGDVDNLAGAMVVAMNAPADASKLASELSDRVSGMFRVEGMLKSCMAFYDQVLTTS